MPHHSPVIHQHTRDIHRRDGGIAFESFCQGLAPVVSNVIICRTQWDRPWMDMPPTRRRVTSGPTHAPTTSHTYCVCTGQSVVGSGKIVVSWSSDKTNRACPTPIGVAHKHTHNPSLLSLREAHRHSPALCHCHVMRTQNRVWAQTAMIGRRLIRGTEAEAQQWACGRCVTP